MVAVLVPFRSLRERRTRPAAVRVHRRPLVDEVGVHRLLERLPTPGACAVLELLQRERQQPVNLRQGPERGDAERVRSSGPQLSEEVGGLRVAETLREKSGTATFDRTRSFASFVICAN